MSDDEQTITNALFVGEMDVSCGEVNMELTRSGAIDQQFGQAVFVNLTGMRILGGEHEPGIAKIEADELIVLSVGDVVELVKRLTHVLGFLVVREPE